MPATYSINIGTQYETTRKGDIISVLKEIPDNTSKLISPKDVRDAFLTTWASSPFKQTRTISGIEYVGLDSGSPVDRDIKQRIFLGKRSFGNQDIMSSSLLNSTTADIFVYNTKSDSSSQDQTSMAFLAGTNSSLFSTAPYISSVYNGDTIDFGMFNPQLNGGSINLYSNTGYVVINGIRFPKVSDNASATNGKILRYVGNYPNGYLKWDDSSVTLKHIGETGSTTEIFGGTVSVNGYDLEFVNPDLVPSEIGGIPSGFSFSSTSFNGKKWPLSEVIRKLLYPRKNPIIGVTASSSVTGTPYVELGTFTPINFRWNMSIFPRNEEEYISDYIITTKVDNSVTNTDYMGMSFSGIPGSTFSGAASLTAATFSVLKTTNFVFNATDIWSPTRFTAANYPLGFSYSATASVYHIYPIYYGFSNTAITNTSSFNSIVPTLNKMIIPYPGASASITIPYSGTGYLYFIHQTSSFTTPVSKIYDANGFLIHDMDDKIYSSFNNASTNGLTVTGTTPYSVSSTWKVWRSKYLCSYTGGNKFIFRF